MAMQQIKLYRFQLGFQHLLLDLLVLHLLLQDLPRLHLHLNLHTLQ